MATLFFSEYHPQGQRKLKFVSSNKWSNQSFSLKAGNLKVLKKIQAASIIFYSVIFVSTRYYLSECDANLAANLNVLRILLQLTVFFSSKLIVQNISTSWQSPSFCPSFLREWACAALDHPFKLCSKDKLETLWIINSDNHNNSNSSFSLNVIGRNRTTLNCTRRSCQYKVSYSTLKWTWFASKLSVNINNNISYVFLRSRQNYKQRRSPEVKPE